MSIKHHASSLFLSISAKNGLIALLLSVLSVVLIGAGGQLFLSGLKTLPAHRLIFLANGRLEHLSENQWEKFTRVMRDAWNISNSPEIASWLGLGYAEWARLALPRSISAHIRWQEAEEWLKTALRMRPVDSRAWLYLSYAQSRSNSELTLKSLELSIISEPHRPEALPHRLTLAGQLDKFWSPRLIELLLHQGNLLKKSRPSDYERLIKVIDEASRQHEIRTNTFMYPDLILVKTPPDTPMPDQENSINVQETK
jgi:uncharacterized protein HemY